MIKRLLIIFFLLTSICYAGGAGDFNNSNDIISNTSLSTTNTGTTTVMYWVKENSTAEASIDIELQNGNSTNSTTFTTNTLWSDGNCYINVNSTSTRIVHDCSTHTGKWLHIAFTWNNSTTTTELFLNGVSVATQTSVPSGTQSFTGYTIGNGIEEFASASDSSFYDFRIYERVLSDAEISMASRCLNKPVGPNMLVHLLLAIGTDSPQQSNYQDLSGNGNNGICASADCPQITNDAPPASWCN